MRIGHWNSFDRGTLSILHRIKILSGLHSALFEWSFWLTVVLSERGCRIEDDFIFSGDRIWVVLSKFGKINNQEVSTTMLMARETSCFSV